MEPLVDLLLQQISNYSQEELESHFAKCEPSDICDHCAEELLPYHEDNIDQQKTMRNKQHTNS